MIELGRNSIAAHQNVLGKRRAEAPDPMTGPNCSCLCRSRIAVAQPQLSSLRMFSSLLLILNPNEPLESYCLRALDATPLQQRQLHPLERALPGTVEEWYDARQTALGRVKRGKAMGADDIPAELLTALGQNVPGNLT